MLFDWVEVAKPKHPNKGHTLNNRQRPMYRSVCYAEATLIPYSGNFRGRKLRGSGKSDYFRENFHRMQKPNRWVWHTQISRIKLLQVALRLQNSWTFSPLKVFCYEVLCFNHGHNHHPLISKSFASRVCLHVTVIKYHLIGEAAASIVQNLD